jgi:hypothetical protein
MPVPFPAKMLSLLRDPLGLEPLELDGDHLVNRASQRRYPDFSRPGGVTSAWKRLNIER